MQCRSVEELLARLMAYEQMNGSSLRRSSLTYICKYYAVQINLSVREEHRYINSLSFNINNMRRSHIQSYYV